MLKALDLAERAEIQKAAAQKAEAELGLDGLARFAEAPSLSPFPPGPGGSVMRSESHETETAGQEGDAPTLESGRASPPRLRVVLS